MSHHLGLIHNTDDERYYCETCTDFFYAEGTFDEYCLRLEAIKDIWASRSGLWTMRDDALLNGTLQATEASTQYQSFLSQLESAIINWEYLIKLAHGFPDTARASALSEHELGVLVRELYKEQNDRIDEAESDQIDLEELRDNVEELLEILRQD